MCWQLSDCSQRDSTPVPPRAYAVFKAPYWLTTSSTVHLQVGCACACCADTVAVWCGCLMFLQALAEKEGDGMAKMLYRKDTGEILGVHIIGLHAADLIHEASNAIATKQTVQVSTELLLRWYCKSQQCTQPDNQGSGGTAAACMCAPSLVSFWTQRCLPCRSPAPTMAVCISFMLSTVGNRTESRVCCCWDCACCCRTSSSTCTLTPPCLRCLTSCSSRHTLMHPQ